jgi:hypothetical protein
MKRPLPPLATLAALLLAPTSATLDANEATMAIACQSIRVPGASVDAENGFSYAISYTTDVSNEGDFISFNEEVYPENGTSGYFTFFYLEETLLEEAVWAGFLDLTIPEAGDDNLNFLTDFLEVDLAVEPVATSGTITIGNASRPVVAVWSREAGQIYGTVQISFSSPSQGIPELTFTHSFEVFHFRGKLTYQPPAADGSITASVDLPRVGGEGSYAGPFPLKRNNQVELERLNAKWIGPTAEEFEVLGTYEIDGIELFIDKVPSRPQYVGSFFFFDGIPSTPDFIDEFDVWDVFIADPNDADSDGVPDLSDTGGVVATPPTLAVSLSEGSLKLTITGQAGQTVIVERKPTLDTAAWTEVEPVTLTGTTKEITLPLSGDNSDFYRAR